MRPKAQKPIRTEVGSAHTDFTETHPAYVMLGAHRFTATPGLRMAGSDFLHHGGVSISLREAEVNRSLSSDWWHAGRVLFEVNLSEAQWATFVARPNWGDGVPATLTFGPDGPVPSIDVVDDVKARFRLDVERDITEAIAALEDLVRAAPTKALRQKAEVALGRLKAGIPWVMQQFEEHAEGVVERMKVEVDAYVTDAVTRAGVAALGGSDPVLTLDTGDVVGGYAFPPEDEEES